MANKTRNTQSRSKATAWLTALIVILMIACVGVGLIGYYSAGFSDWSQFEAAFGGDKQPADETPGTGKSEENGFNTVITNSERVLLAVSAATTAAESNTVSKTLTATVLPEDAPDKSVDWSVAWYVPLEGEPDVTDYVTVTPQSDGSNIATVKAHQGFEGASIYITVTTRIGGFSAMCLVTYDGAPETLSLVLNDVEYQNTDSLELSAGQTYSVDLKLDNTLGQVGSKYGTFEIVSVSMQGRFNAVKRMIVNGSVRKTENIVIDLADPTFYLYDLETEGNGDLYTIQHTDFAEFSIQGDTLTIQAKKSEASYRLPSGSSFVRTGTEVVYDSPYVDPRTGGQADNCRLYITVRDTVSDVKSLFFIDITSTVTGVSISDSVITF